MRCNGANATFVGGVESSDFAALDELIFGEFTDLRGLACVCPAIEQDSGFSYSLLPPVSGRVEMYSSA